MQTKLKERLWLANFSLISGQGYRPLCLKEDVNQLGYLGSARFDMEARREDLGCYVSQHRICLVEVAYLVAVLKVKSGEMLARVQTRHC